MLLVNCDLGERGTANPIDDQILKYIDIANIACGGHAGDKQSIDYYTKLCRDNNIKITAHISYPDQDNFGRIVMKITDSELIASFDKQLSLFNNIKSIKPHGALYNELNINKDLAKTFIDWCLKNNINELILSPYGVVTGYAELNGIHVITESFVERGYMIDDNNNPTLIPRGRINAEITDVKSALEQYLELNSDHITIDMNKHTFVSKTACIHSDSKIALKLAIAIYQTKGNT
jgi:UPF0271 protein